MKKMCKKIVGILLAFALTFTSFDVSVFAAPQDTLNEETAVEEVITMTPSEEDIVETDDKELEIAPQTDADESIDDADAKSEDEVINEETDAETDTERDASIDKNSVGEDLEEYDEVSELTGAVIHSGKVRELDWSITSDGVLTITGSGMWMEDDVYYERYDAPQWCNYANDIKKAVVKVKELGVPYNFFYNCINLTTVDFTGTDTSVLFTTDYMFHNCKSLKSVNWGVFNTKNVRTMNHMFDGCSSITSLDFVNGLNMSSVTDVSMMFANCTGLTKVELSKLNLKNAYLVSGLFYGCSNLREFSGYGADLSKATSIRGLLNHCTSLEKADLRNMKIPNLELMDDLFNDCRKLKNVYFGATNTSKVKSFARMFRCCESIESINMLTCSTASLEEIESMFAGCSSLKELEIGGFDLGKLGEPDYTNPKYYCVVKYDSMGNQMTDYMGSEANDWEPSFAAPYRNNYVFEGCSNLKTIKCPSNIPSNVFIDFPSHEGGRWLEEYTNKIVYYLPQQQSLVTCKWMPGSFYPNIKLYNDVGDGEHIGSVDVNWSDNSFLKSSYEYNHEIARVAACLSTLVYNKDMGTIAQGLFDLGFETKGAYNEKSAKDAKIYYPDEKKWEVNEDEAGLYSPLWITHKRVKVGGTERVLLCVVFRGTSGTEWIDNFDSGLGENHAGFDRAAWRGKDKIDEYMKHNNLNKDNMYVLVTGHSRGAAAANLLGKKIDDNEVETLKGIDLNRVYVYSFATPNNTRMSNCSDAKYNNICSIINPEDFVTKVMPRKWGYYRNGYTLVLPSSSIEWSKKDGSLVENKSVYKYKEFKKEVEKQYNKHNCKKFYITYTNGMQAVEDYVASITKKVPNVYDYYNKSLAFWGSWTDDKKYSGKTDTEYWKKSLFGLFKDTLGYYMAGNREGRAFKDEGIDNFIDAVHLAYGEVGSKTSYFFISHQALKSDFERAHDPCNYLAMMNVISEEALLKDKEYVYVKISCPVDVAVKDESGNIVGQIKDDEVIYTEDGLSLEVEGESKTVYLPGDSEFTLQITGNDNGTMDYSVVSCDPDSGEVSRIVYNDVPIVEGEAYTETIVPEKEIEDLELVNPDGDAVSGGVVYTGDELGTISVDIEVEGVGSAESVENLSPGDYVLLKATTNGLNSFLGWYEEGADEPISTEAEYGISVMDNIKLIAKFTSNTEGMWAEKPLNQVYTGKDLKPDINVYDGDKLLEKNVDYTLTYKNTKNAYELSENDKGFDKTKAPTIIVKGKGDYSGSSSDVVYFTIEKMDIADEDITVSISDQKYVENKENKAKVLIKNGKTSLKEVTDYTVEYKGDIKEPGIITINIKGAGNYKGSREDSYKIYRAPDDFKNCIINKISDVVYTGEAIKPYITVTKSKNDSSVLIQDEDYTVTYLNNVNVGTATAIIKGAGDYEGYGNTKSVTFKIVPKAVTSNDVTITISEDTVYTGTALKPEIVVTDKSTGAEIDPVNYSVTLKNNTNVASKDAGKNAPTISVAFKKNYKGSAVMTFDIAPLELTEEDLSVTVPDFKSTGKPITDKDIKPVIKYGKKTLTKNKDYTVSVQDKTSGIMTATIELVGNYAGTIVKDFRVYTAQIKADNFIVNVSDETLVYDGNKKTPKVTVKVMYGDDEVTLTEGKDYKLTYSDNVKAADKIDKKAPAVKVSGIGAYTGSTGKYPFTINKKTVTEEDLVITVTDMKYTGREVKPKVTIIDKTTGKTFPSAEYSLSYINNVKKSEKGEENSPAVIITGKANYNIAVDESFRQFRIYGTDVSTFTFAKIENVAYDKKQHKPHVDVYADKKMTTKLTESEDGVTGDYIVTYGTNTKVGKGTVTITGINNYGGSKTLNFTILPKWLAWLIH